MGPQAASVSSAFPDRWHPFTLLACGAALVLLTTAGTVAATRQSLLAALAWAGTTTVLCAVLAARGGRLRPWAAASAAVLVPLWVSQLMVHGLVGHGSAPALLDWWWLRVTAAGLRDTSAAGLRLIPLVCGGILCGVLIERRTLLAAIDESRLPNVLGYVAGTALGLGPELAERSRAIFEAQAVRGVDHGRAPLRWLRSARAQAMPLITTAIDDSTQRAAHLQARGFPGGGRIVRYRPLPDSRGQRALGVLALVLGLVGAGVLLWL